MTLKTQLPEGKGEARDYRMLEDRSNKNHELKICYRRGNSNNERAEHGLDLRYSEDNSNKMQTNVLTQNS